MLIDHNPTPNSLRVPTRREPLHPEVTRTDLALVRHKLAHPDDGATPIDGAELDFVEREYRRFLTLLAEHPHSPLVPTKGIDRVWHAHILDTRAYADDCDRIFGHFVHHDPSLGVDDAEDIAKLQAMFELTAALYEARFGEAYAPEASRCEGHACHVPSSCRCRVPGACTSVR
ncbi:MAG: hypothetical protein GY898_27750 [Proteobacteria bacterium]|nr:hypothetical protein [Pseudomonadota bacterium]